MTIWTQTLISWEKGMGCIWTSFIVNTVLMDFDKGGFLLYREAYGNCISSVSGSDVERVFDTH